MPSIYLRTFRDGDEPAVVDLFNNVHSRYGGFVPRTVDYWRWCCLERPDVECDGVLLAFDCDRLCGYLVAGSSGYIWEFCVTNDDKKVEEALLNGAMNYLEKKGVSSVEVNVPKGLGVAEVLRGAGFDELAAAEMFITTLNPSVLVQALASPVKDVLQEKLDDEFSFRLLGVPYGVSKEFSVKIRDDFVKVVEGFLEKPSVIVELEFMDFLSVLFRGSSPSRLFLTGKMKVQPFHKLGGVLKFFSTVRLRGSWFFPLSDYI